MDAASWEPQGQALLDYINGERDNELIIHSYEGQVKVPVEIYFRSWENFPELEQYALSLCQGRVLDIGAGSGCHSLALKDMGLEVHSIDISPLMVEVMKKQGLKNVYCGDIDHFEAEPFDTVVMFMNGIGFVKSPEGLGIFLEKIKQLLKPDGQLIFDSTDISVEDPERAKNNNEKYYGIVEYQLEYKGWKGRKFDWLFIDTMMLHKISKKNGWHCQIVYDDMDGQYLARLRRIE